MPLTADPGLAASAEHGWRRKGSGAPRRHELSRPALARPYNDRMWKIALGFGVTVLLAVIIWLLFAGG